jgi:hypothetical protein
VTSYKTPEQAFEATAKRIGGALVKFWTWPNGALTARFKMPDGSKTFRPYRPADGAGREDGDPPGLWPLYRAAAQATSLRRPPRG